MYASRGCTIKVRHEDLLSHHEECGFAPVQCSHDGCEVTVNKQDVVSHQENCEFRSVTCEECLEAMKKRDYGKHNCVLRKEMDEFKRGLAEDEQIRQIASRVMQPSVAEGQLAGEARQSDNSRQPETELQQPESDPSQTPQGESNDGEPTGSCMASNDVETVTMTSQIQRQVPVDREIFVAGSCGRSCEIFFRL